MISAVVRAWDWFADGDDLPVRDLARALRRSLRESEDGAAPERHRYELSPERGERLEPWADALARGLGRVAMTTASRRGLRLAAPVIELTTAPDLDGAAFRLHSYRAAPLREAVVGGPTRLPDAASLPAPVPARPETATAPEELETDLDRSSRPEPQSVVLRLESGPESGRELVLPDGALVAGRGAGCDLVLADEQRKLSRRHALLRVVGGTLTVEDLGSRNGLSIDGVTVARGELRLGQRLQLGGLRLLRVAGRAAADD